MYITKYVMNWYTEIYKIMTQTKEDKNYVGHFEDSLPLPWPQKPKLITNIQLLTYIRTSWSWQLAFIGHFYGQFSTNVQYQI